jgi:hypothetical protein
MKALLKTEIVLETRGTQFGAVLACALGFDKNPAPCFVGKAIITSDGYVQCNFTGKDGRNHHGAFVGSVRDLVNNTKHAADHFKLGTEDRADLYKAVREWIATDYSHLNQPTEKVLRELEPCVTA